MVPVITLVVLLLVALGAYLALADSGGQRITRIRQTTAGICQAALDQTARKRRNQQKALDFLGEHGPASNAELRQQLGVSRQTITRYMDQLEERGVIEQLGSSGRGVLYALRK